MNGVLWIAPVPKDGRYFASGLVSNVQIEVSILARPEGRALLRRWAIVYAIQDVSILARPEGRALLHWDAATICFARFQSSPVPKDGRYEETVSGLAGVRKVSILARPEGRALQAAITRNSATYTFQSSPVPKDGRY